MFLYWNASTYPSSQFVPEPPTEIVNAEAWLRLCNKDHQSINYLFGGSRKGGARALNAETPANLAVSTLKDVSPQRYQPPS